MKEGPRKEKAKKKQKRVRVREEQAAAVAEIRFVRDGERVSYSSSFCSLFCLSNNLFLPTMCGVGQTKRMEGIKSLLLRTNE